MAPQSVSPLAIWHNGDGALVWSDCPDSWVLLRAVSALPAVRRDIVLDGLVHDGMLLLSTGVNPNETSDGREPAVVVCPLMRMSAWVAELPPYQLIGFGPKMAETGAPEVDPATIAVVEAAMVLDGVER
jgi:hypothetical protein